jgi:hypothetical protein
MDMKDNQPNIDAIENLPEGYLTHLKENKEFIESLAKEELKNNRMDTVEAHQIRIKMDRDKTQRDKSKFISEIKSGLGEQIKANPNKVEFIKRPWYYKLKQFIKNVFKKVQY